MAWYHSIIALQTSAFLLSICTELRFDIPICSLSAPEGHNIPLASDAEMRQHSFTQCNKLDKSRKKIKRSFHWGKDCSKDKFHGFILFNNLHFGACEPLFVKEDEQQEWNDVFHQRMPALLTTPHYRNAFVPIFARVNGTVEERKGDSRRKQLRLKHILKIATRRYKDAKSAPQKAKTQKELELVQLAKSLLARHYSRLVTVCPHPVPPTCDSPDFLSFIESQPGCMAQEIHLDSLDAGWSFLTALERDQELLVLFDGYKAICMLEELASDRAAACICVRTKLREECGREWPDQEWIETIEPRVWNWLCSKETEQRYGSVPDLQLKRVTIPKGWTIAVDSRTPHGGAPAGENGGFRVHAYGVVRAIDRTTALDSLFETSQDTTVNLKSHLSPFFPLLYWAQRQAAAVFGAV